MKITSRRYPPRDEILVLIMVIASFACIAKHMAIYHEPPVMEDRGFNITDYRIGYPDNEVISNYSIAVDRGLTNMSAWEFAYTSPRSGNIQFSIQTNIIEDYLHGQPWSNLNELYFDIYQNVTSDNTTMEDMLGRLLNDTSIAAWRRML